MRTSMIWLAACCLMSTTAGAQSGNIVFEGTVTKAGGSTLPTVKPTDRTVVVKINRVIEKPETVALRAGDEITVQLTEANAAKVGTTRTFRTTGWIYGKSMAVREVVEPLSAGLVQRVKSADVVVTGQVTQVRQGPEQKPTKVSEHNPTRWREAVVRVSSGLKGSAATRDVVVRFPESDDVKWRGLPPLTEGKAFTFLLHKDTVSGSPTGLVLGRSVQAYTVASPQDVLSIDQSALVRVAIAQAK